MSVVDMQAVRIRRSLETLLGHLEVTVPEEGLLKGKLVLWYIPYPKEPERRDPLVVANNSYQDASLNALAFRLKEAKSSLEGPSS